MKKIKAFSLLEAALTISIIGLSLSIVFPLLKSIQHSKKQKLNEVRYIKIKKAIQLFVLNHGYLPNPASDLKGRANCQVYKGFIPYITLNIDKADAYDANNKPLIFVVNKNLCKNNEDFTPITLSLKNSPIKGKVSFCRIYEWDAEGNLNKVDKICSALDNLIVYENDLSVIDENENFYIMHPLKKFDNYEEYQKWLHNSLTTTQNKFKNCNCVAWILISSVPLKNPSYSKNENDSESNIYFKNKKSNEMGEFKDEVFYQTRFDIANQIRCFCTKEPYYEA